MAAALAEDSLSLAPAPHTYRPPTLGTGVTVLFERKGRADGQQLMTTAVLNGSTSVHEIKLTGRHRGWFREDDRLVRPILSTPSTCRLRLSMKISLSTAVFTHLFCPFLGRFSEGESCWSMRP